MTSAIEIITRLGGVATRQQLIHGGCDGFAITAAVRANRIRRVRRAHYATHDAPGDAILAAWVGGRLAGVSAARSYRLWSGFDRRLHVAVAPNASRLRIRSPRFDAVRTPDIADRELALHWVDAPAARECWRVPLPTCLVQVAQWADHETAIACIETAVWRYGLDPSRLVASLGATTSLATARLAGIRSGTQEGQESLISQRLERLGLVVDRQVEVPGVGRVDAWIRGTRVIIETDGWEFHSRREAFERDRARDRALAARGFVVIRLTYGQITTDWPTCEREIRAAVDRFQEIS